MGYMTDERLMIKETAAQFTDDVVIPIANKLDPEKGMMPRELLDQMAEMGFLVSEHRQNMAAGNGRL